MNNLETNTRPHLVDRHVGRRVCERRMSLGFSQADLAQGIGLSFQQVQKYEKGTNRMSASKLWDIANFLVVDIGYFFIGLPDDVSVGAEPDATALGRPTRASIEISRLAAKLTTKQQRLMVELITDMAH